MLVRIENQNKTERLVYEYLDEYFYGDFYEMINDAKCLDDLDEISKKMVYSIINYEHNIYLKDKQSEIYKIVYDRLYEMMDENGNLDNFEN